MLWKTILKKKEQIIYKKLAEERDRKNAGLPEGGSAIELSHELSLYASVAHRLISPDDDLMKIHADIVDNPQADYCHRGHMDKFEECAFNFVQQESYEYVYLMAFLKKTRNADPEHSDYKNMLYWHENVLRGDVSNKTVIPQNIKLLRLMGQVSVSKVALLPQKALSLVDKAIPPVRSKNGPF